MIDTFAAKFAPIFLDWNPLKPNSFLCQIFSKILTHVKVVGT